MVMVLFCDDDTFPIIATLSGFGTLIRVLIRVLPCYFFV